MSEAKKEESVEEKIAKIRTKIGDAEQALIHRAMAVESASGSLKAARQLYKLAIEKLQGLRVELAMAENPPESGQVDEDGDVIDAEYQVDDGPVVSDTTAAESTAGDPNAWAEASVVTLNLKESLVNRLNEHDVWTIGQLEKLRENISMGRAEWPKGIGKAKITEIEDAITNYLMKTRDREVFEALKKPAEVAGDPIVDDSIPVKIELPNDPEPLSSILSPDGDKGVEPPYFLPNRPTASQWQSMTDDEENQYLEARASDIFRIAKEYPEVLKPLIPTGGYFDRGKESHGGGEPIAWCELPSSPAQDDYIRGWVASEIESPYFFNQDGDLIAGVLTAEESAALSSHPETPPVPSRHAKAGVEPLPHAGALLVDELDDL